MWTIIWISLCWLALSVLMAWVWHRLRTAEYRAEYTEKEARIYGQTDTATFAGMDGAAKAMKEKLEAAFSGNDPPEAWPEDRSRRSQIIGDIAEELVFGDGKEEP